jgi:predicted nucleotidyltransferase
MARGKVREISKGEQVGFKTYFYALRPLLAINWLEQGLGVVPTEFGALVDRIVTAPGLKAEIGRLIDAKRLGDESARGPHVAAISEFIEREIRRHENHRFDYAKPAAPASGLDQMFIASLREVWSSESA